MKERKKEGKKEGKKEEDCRAGRREEGPGSGERLGTQKPIGASG